CPHVHLQRVLTEAVGAVDLGGPVRGLAPRLAALADESEIDRQRFPLLAERAQRGTGGNHRLVSPAGLLGHVPRRHVPLHRGGLLPFRAWPRSQATGALRRIFALTDLHGFLQHAPGLRALPELLEEPAVREQALGGTLETRMVAQRAIVRRERGARIAGLLVI